MYEVDETGTHGKAYSLTVYNLSDKYFCKKPGYYTPSPRPDIMPPMFNNSKFEDAAVPTSLEDGWANCQKMKNESDWTNKLLALKWVEDLAAQQGVAWYIPAIEELKDLVEYMSNAKFEVFEEKDSGTGEVIMEYEWINPVNATAVETAWDAVRDIYKTYTDDKQYLVFHSAKVGDDGSATPVDARVIVEDPFKSPVSKGVVICDNVVNKFGQSYLSGVGILVGYSQDVIIDHNDVSYGSYTGISVGWGWGLETPMCGCKIRNNRFTHIIENHLYDGSGLYILGRHLMDKKNIVSGNYLEGGHGYAGLYFDEKADNYIAKNNYIGRGRKWFLLMHDVDYGLHDISVEDNFIESIRKYMNSYSPGHAFKPKTKKQRNISIHGNISPINPYWKENKQRIYDNSGVRKV